MDQIEGLILTKLKKIENPKGDIFHCMKNSDDGFNRFGEAYFTKVNFCEIKGWNKHSKMTLNLTVPVGKISFVIYDNRNNSSTNGIFNKIELSENNYFRLTVPPGLWISFEGKDNGTNLILNIADITHDPEESEKKDLDEIKYNWV